MLIGLLGDIHGNAAALDAVLSAAHSLKVERLLVTGDLVGYYFSPRSVLTQLQQWNVEMVRGNHEEMLCGVRSGVLDGSLVTARYGPGLRLALEQMSESELDMLCALPHPKRLDVGGRKILLCHGAPWSVNQYVYPDADDELIARCASSHDDLTVMGHTHYPMCRSVGNSLLVNPGSVGQPRNRVAMAQWALYDTDSGEVEMRAEPYDVEGLARECRERYPELPYLADVLLRK